jgi:hypothetical protein
LKVQAGLAAGNSRLSIGVATADFVLLIFAPILMKLPVSSHASIALRKRQSI